jgi:hypothetical protein
VRKPPSEALRLALWGAAICAGWSLIARFLGDGALGTAAVQTVFSEGACGRLGVAWSDPRKDPPQGAAIATKVIAGAASGVLFVALAITAAKVTGVSVRAGTFSLPALGVAGASAVLLAIKCELVEHGLMLRLLAAVPAQVQRVLACALASAAVHFGSVPHSSPVSLTTTACIGAFTALLWVRQRGAWMAVGARSTIFLGVQTGTAGSLLDVEPGVSVVALPAVALGSAIACSLLILLPRLITARASASQASKKG